jgi:mannose-6-phosphate isomerase-like protein (cupin superfamily)
MTTPQDETPIARYISSLGYREPDMSASRGTIRRVVTTIDENDKAVVLFDSDSPHAVKRPGRGNVSNLLWVTDGCPADMTGAADRASPEAESVDATARMKELAHEPPIRGLPPRHPLMHRTRTIDYAIILEGEIDMLLDDSEIHLKAGDVLIQQGTNHAWINRGASVCRIAFVLIDAKAT